MKNNRTKLIVVALAAAAVVLAAGACKGKSPSERLAENSIAKAIERASGGQAKVDLKDGTIKVKTAEGDVEIGATKTWPADFPIDVPKPGSGTIAGVVRSNQEDKKHWNITLQNAEPGTFAKYQDELKAKGWEIKVVTNVEDGGLLNAQKDKLAIVATFADKGKTISLVVTNQIDQ
jgi:hypothetical protein